MEAATLLYINSCNYLNKMCYLHSLDRVILIIAVLKRDMEMKHRCIFATLCVGFLTSVFLIDSVLPLASQNQTAIERGESLVRSRCAVCHTERSLPDLVKRCADREGATFLDTFLKKHHAPDDSARADIIAFLTCRD